MEACAIPQPAGTCDTAATGCDPTDVDCDAFAGCYVSVGNEHDGIPRAELRDPELVYPDVMLLGPRRATCSASDRRTGGELPSGPAHLLCDGSTHTAWAADKRGSPAALTAILRGIEIVFSLGSVPVRVDTVGVYVNASYQAHAAGSDGLAFTYEHDDLVDTWDESRSYCEDLSAELCTYDDYCPLANESDPSSDRKLNPLILGSSQHFCPESRALGLY